jgi:hypothetical protein
LAVVFLGMVLESSFPMCGSPLVPFVAV